jgi:hypothetical protein
LSPAAQSAVAAAGGDGDADAAKLLLVQFLSWVESRPRSYADLQEAWRSSCPRLTIWEDAIEGDLVCFVADGALGKPVAHLVLTPRGRALLDAQAR